MGDRATLFRQKLARPNFDAIMLRMNSNRSNHQPLTARTLPYQWQGSSQHMLSTMTQEERDRELARALAHLAGHEIDNARSRAEAKAIVNDYGSMMASRAARGEHELLADAIALEQYEDDGARQLKRVR